MKKRLALIAAIVLAACVCVSVVLAVDIADNKRSFEGLSEEDKAVMTQIAKHSDTEVDFRKNMQEKIQDKTYDVSFVELNDERSPDKVIYANDLGDEFEYDIETGKLCEVVLNSNIVEKSDDSIGIDAAHKIALEFFPEDRDIGEYTQYSYSESSKGYFFWYIRYIGKYRTTDSFSITVGFDGSVVDLSDSTHEFDGKKINFDGKFIDSKINAFAEENKAVNVDYDNATVLMSEGKICVSVYYEIEYEYSDNGCFATDIPLEE